MDGRTLRRVSGKQIREARLSAKLSQAGLARHLGVEQGQISRWEREKFEPRMQSVTAIAAATGRDIEFFLTGEPDDEEEDPSPVSLDHLLRDYVQRLVREAMAEELVA